MRARMLSAAKTVQLTTTLDPAAAFKCCVTSHTVVCGVMRNLTLWTARLRQTAFGNTAYCRLAHRRYDDVHQHNLAAAQEQHYQCIN